MGFKEGTGNFFGSLVFIICFIIGCLFIYWAVEYWVYNNFDRERYEISKIQPAGGGDSWSFWKLDRRTGRVEYCTLMMPANAKVDENTDFVCVRAREVVSEDPAEVARRQAAQPTFGRTSENTTETPAIPAVEVDSASTPATPAEATATPAAQ